VLDGEKIFGIVTRTSYLCCVKGTKAAAWVLGWLDGENAPVEEPELEETEA